MDKDQLRELLDNVYELEALIQLAIVREDCSSDLLRLIEKKRKLVSGTIITPNLADTTLSSHPEVVTHPEVPDLTLSYELAEIDGAEEMPEAYEVNEGLESDEDNEIEPEETVSSSAMPESYEMEDEEPEEEDEETEEEYEEDNEEELSDENLEESPEEYVSVDTYSEDNYEGSEDLEEDIEDTDDYDESVDTEIKEEPKVQETITSSGSKNRSESLGVTSVKADSESLKNDSKKNSSLKGKLVFSLNDRYRFKRELFDNSDAEFNTTMAFVASMEDYEEAEDYFYDELGFDPKNKAVEDFMRIIAKYFQ